MSWHEAWALTSRLLVDPDSHLLASIAGWGWVPGPVRATGTDFFEGYVNANRGKNKTPYRAERPWTKPLARDAVAHSVSQEDRAQRERLDALLGLVEQSQVDPAVLERIADNLEAARPPE